MGKVVAHMSMSLDGFVAGPDDEVDQVFAWYGSGPVRVETANPDVTMQVSEESARLIRSAAPAVVICGRRFFELTRAWGGTHPTGAHVVVVTRRGAPDGWPRDGLPFTFVTDGIASAVTQARELAGERDVAIATPTMTRLGLDAGLVDEIAVDLAPVVLGDGVPLFAHLEHAPIGLGTPTVVEADGVTHLRYAVNR